MSTPVIHRFAEEGMGSVNTYLIEADDAVLVVDCQRSLSAARKALEGVARTGKPVAAIFLTHAHPDHFGGARIFVDAAPDAPFYASRTTRASLAEDRQGFIKASRKVLGKDFPKQVPLPTREVVDGQVITAGGVRLLVHEAGAGESESMTILELPGSGVLFAADTVQHDQTAFLLESRSALWLKQLNALRARFAPETILYPGHGEPGPVSDLLDRQSEYLSVFRSLVEAECDGPASDGKLRRGGANRVVEQMNLRYPGFLPVAMIPDLLNKNVDAVLKEFAAKQ